MIAVSAGNDECIKLVQIGSKDGFITQYDFSKSICAIGKSFGELKSDDRQRAAAYCASRG